MDERGFAMIDMTCGTDDDVFNWNGSCSEIRCIASILETQFLARFGVKTFPFALPADIECCSLGWN